MFDVEKCIPTLRKYCMAVRIKINAASLKEQVLTTWPVLKNYHLHFKNAVL